MLGHLNIYLNDSSAEELQLLPGIGKTLSERIIQNRPYKWTRDVKKVRGISEKKLRTIEKSKEYKLLVDKGHNYRNDGEWLMEMLKRPYVGKPPGTPPEQGFA